MDDMNKKIEDKVFKVIQNEKKVLKDIKIAICGLGGAGNAFAINAVHRGFEDFLLIDDDIVELSNLRRLIGYCPEDIGKNKIDIMRQYIQEINPEARVDVLAERIETENAKEKLSGIDIIINCFDNNRARLDNMIFAARNMIPILDFGAGQEPSDEGDIIGKGAQYQFYIPGKTPCFLCNGMDTSDILSDTEKIAREKAGYLMGTSITPPNAGYLNWHIAMFGIEELVKYILDKEYIKYFLWDEMCFKGIPIQFVKMKSCSICGDRGIEGIEEVKDYKMLSRDKIRNKKNNKGTIIKNFERAIQE